MDWNRAIFDGNLKKLQINQGLPRVAPEQLPLVIDPDTAIYRAEYQYPEYNKKTQYLHGPFWTFDDVAVGTFQVLDQPTESVKQTLSSTVAQNRYDWEISGTSTEIQGVTVSIETDRETRNIFVQALVLTADTETRNWKFPEGFFELAKSDLAAVVAAGAAHIQQAFDWEMQKVQEISACTELAELDALELRTPVQIEAHAARAERQAGLRNN
jgi:hypothetical protein